MPIFNQLVIKNTPVEKNRLFLVSLEGNILASGNTSLKLFMAPLETMKLLTF